ncbi:MAG: hypothetical protein ACLPOO_03465 [Terriglobales bacterium]
MKPRHLAVLLPVLLIVASASASDQQPATQKSSPPPRMNSHTRMEMIRAFESELVYIRTQFPMGKKGLTLKNGALSPSGVDLQRLMVTWGPAVKPGDQARITSISIKEDRIHFEINGGPIKKQKWYERIEVDGASGTAPITPSSSNANPRGSCVDLVFDHYIPEMDAAQLKHLLRPVFDFDSKSAVEAYLETVPPKVKEAIKNHQVLVGMNREMVIYSKGRAPKKIREKDGEAEYEDWIYGEPPQDVDFVRFMGDEVTRVETMKVTGEKIVRVEKEVDLTPKPSVAAVSPTSEPAHAPTLRRPGESLPTAPPTTTATQPLPNSPPPPPPSDPGGSKSPDFAPSELAQADLAR